MSHDDLCLACTELLDEIPDLPGTDGGEVPAAVLLFSEPLQLEAFLKKLHRATHGQTAIQRRLAIVACAKRQAEQLRSARGAVPPPPATRSHLLKKSISGKLTMVLLLGALAVLGFLLAAYLLY